MPDDAAFAVSLTHLRILLSNLLQNTFAHSGAGQVKICLEGDRLRLSNPLNNNTLSQTGRRGFGRAIAQRLADQCACSIFYWYDEQTWYLDLILRGKKVSSS